MYVETKGYTIMKTDEMNFLDNNFEFSEELEEARIYIDLTTCREDYKNLVEEYGDIFEIVNYNRTIWIDKIGLEPEKRCCCKKDIDDFGIPASVMKEVETQHMMDCDVLREALEREDI